MITPINTPATNCTYGRFSAPRSEMYFERVIGWTML
jgi:hypothetical protein